MTRLRRVPVGALVTVGLLVAFFFLASIAVHGDAAYLLKLTFSGMSTGTVASLSGLGLVLTYRATGVFNFAQGAIATVAAFLIWQMVTVMHIPVGIAAPVALLLVGPGLGMLAERTVFRPLEKVGASTSEKLVATLGIFVLLLGICVAKWGFETKTNTPSVFPVHPFHPNLFGVRTTVGSTTIGNLAVVAVICIALTVLLRGTFFGTSMRAVVDKRELAELASINANRVASIAWALGFSFAALAGILLSGSGKLRGLNPYDFSLLVLETFVVAVAAKLRSLPIAVVSGLVLEIVRSVSTVFTAVDAPHWLQLRRAYGQVPTELLAIGLLAFLLIYRNLDEITTAVASGRSIVAGAVGRRAARGTGAGQLGRYFVVALVALTAPLFLHGDVLHDAQKVLGLSLVFLSIVVITGFSGHITLGQAGFAGFGALCTSLAVTGKLAVNLPIPFLGLLHVGFPKLPVFAAMLASAIVVACVGFLTAYPALRRRGLILGLTTLAVGVLLFALVYNYDDFLSGKAPGYPRPSWFTGDRAFYYFALSLLLVAMFFARNIRSGRLGRILGAMRDSETGAKSVGISLRKFKLFIFATSAGMAAIGGTLLAMQAHSFSPDDFQPIYGLFWFTAVVVAGLNYISGAVLAGFLYVFLDRILGVAGLSQFFFGLGALLLGTVLQGGIVGGTSRLGRWLTRRGRQRYAEAREELFVAADTEAPEPEPSDFATRVLQETGR